MKKDKFIHIASIVFIIVGVLHLIRALAGWELVVEGLIIPTWFSFLVAIFLGLLVYNARKLK